ncbi:MAG TPA: isoprenylcysteine carboxylmethyltransferase family protein [Parafilimonas sp.]|nr:isoprenylcysteine carboxylmethyltransferase family protein [Parafilimonas sp.]
MPAIRKIISTVVFVSLMIVLPLLFKPALLINYKTLIILAGALAMFFTQPAFSIQEVVTNKKTDRYSIVIILLASIFSVGLSLIEWAYFKNTAHSSVLFTIIGISLICSGLALRLFSIVTLGKYFTATARSTNEHILIKSGPYSIVRHPSYLGAMVVMIGVPVLLNNVITFFTTIILLSIAYIIRINAEEKLLVSIFGDEYKKYSLYVKKLIPGIW